MNKIAKGSIKLAVAATLAVLMGPALANQAELAQVRAACHADTATLQSMERNSNWCTDDPKLIQARDAAERSCGRAMTMMVSMGLEPKPVKPRAAPPAPSLVITEHVRNDAPATAQFSAMEVDRLCSNAQ